MTSRLKWSVGDTIAGHSHQNTIVLDQALNQFHPKSFHFPQQFLELNRINPKKGSRSFLCFVRLWSSTRTETEHVRSKYFKYEVGATMRSPISLFNQHQVSRSNLRLFNIIRDVFSQFSFSPSFF